MINENAYISLTDIAKYKSPNEPRVVISNWMSSYTTIDFLAMWEQLYNPEFNRMEFQTVRNEPGRLIMTPSQWIERTNADLIRQGIPQIDRLKILREKAYRQLNTLKNNSKALEEIKQSLISEDNTTIEQD